MTDVFAENLSVWKEWQAAPWGRLVYRVGQFNLARHLPATRLSILDVGGGNGTDAIALAALHHDVTLVDASVAMLDDARASADAAKVRDYLTIFHSDFGTHDDRLRDRYFDVVLCHNVLAYVEDVEKTVRSLAGLLAPGGILSVVGANRYSEPYRAALKLGDLRHALSQLDETCEATGIFGAHRHRLAAEDVTPLLANLGLRLIGQYGIRCVCDYLARDELKWDPTAFADLERLELAMTDRYPYYLVARFFQVIAQNVGANG